VLLSLLIAWLLVAQDNSLTFGEEFGQSEPLTARIHNILRSYPNSGCTIIQELLQNADDAGATQAHFILDVRDHGLTSLFHKSMEELQGPALVAYNNALFTDKDFNDIQRLGVGGKRDDCHKIGRFGIGFNR
jgi:sacsin